MKLTQERVVPKLMKPSNGLLREHIVRYEFALDFTYGKVLDIACGVGYGSYLLINKSTNISSILGVDIDSESIQYANNTYPHKNCIYKVKNALKHDLVDDIGLFDTIISFETVEHLQNDTLFIKNLYSCLKPNGILIISTPFGRGRGLPCTDPFHVHQYKEEEFLDLLSCFSCIDIFYQRNELIEKRRKNKKYYLMVAVCKK